MRYILVFTLLLLNLSAFSARASIAVPEPLQPWVAWVLADQEQRLCPYLYNSTSNNAVSDKQCAWPTQLNLDLTENGGQFSQQWQLYAETWVPLPGNAQHWPQAVTVNGTPQPVTIKNGRPSLKLAAGSQLVRGQWQWPQLPKNLALPPASALISLTINNKTVPAPPVDAQGQLWLAKDMQPSTQAQTADTLSLQVFRKISDQIPLQVTSQLVLEVAGEQRQLVLGPLLLDKQIPLLLDSPLPAKIAADGRLTLQVRPGRWIITIHSRYPGEINTLTLPNIPAPWPEQEVWVFAPAPQLRSVAIENLTAIDPQQTNLPSEWQQFPAYQIRAGEHMQLRELTRGNPESQPNQLNLQRQLWLDFDGGGVSVQDTLSGQINQGWRLEANPALALGQVQINGQPQFITRLSAKKPIVDNPLVTETSVIAPAIDQADSSTLAGVEIRQGQVQLTADSRYQGSLSQLAAVGWQTDVQSLQTQLNLPPGWRLFAASGVDQAEHTWVAQWTLLDLFLVLIASGAALRLWGWPWGLLTLITLVLIWQESAGSGFGPPRWVWLNILAATALLKVLAAGRLRKLMIGYRNVCLAVLLLIALPFMAEQVRVAMYPQLANTDYYSSLSPWDETSLNAEAADEQVTETSVTADATFDILESATLAGTAPRMMATSKMPRLEQRRLATPAKALAQLDPNAKLQTGPGLPTWQWQTSQLNWHGPVSAEQQMQLFLLSPRINMLLNLLRVLLLSLLILRMAGFNISRQRGIYCTANQPLALLLPILIVLSSALSLAMPTPAQAQMPDPALLNELQTRLLAPPDCLPDCAQIATLQLSLPASANSIAELNAKLEVHTQAEVALPLPSAGEQWQLSQVLVNGVQAKALRRDDKGMLYLPLPAGIHQVELKGLLHSQPLQLELPLAPRKVQFQGKGWSLSGLDANGVPGGQLQLSREQKNTDLTPLSANRIPDFLEVTRTLSLGLDWQLNTQIRRLSPLNQAISLQFPLIDGESVLTEGLTVKDHKVAVTLAADQTFTSWQSRLEKTDHLTLTAVNTQQWTEIWRLDSSAIWHIDTAELPAVQQQDDQGNWLPEWRPWPGESLQLHISRPAGIAGQTLTIDSSQLAVTAGRNGQEVNLILQMRSSQGGQHSLQLPDNISLQAVQINNQPQTLRLATDGTLLLPLTPGSQSVALSWRQQTSISHWFSTPLVQLNSPSVNNHLQLSLGEDRWVLWTSGPLMGPAVLFWSLLLMISLLAFGLSRVKFTPLGFPAWLLLGIGLSQVPLWMALVVVAWLLALGQRGRWQHNTLGLSFNFAQIGLVVLSLAALSLLFLAIQQGLLGQPNMQISGHDSYGNMLRWYQDRSADLLPQAQVLSVPLWVYRGLMLAWALWLAFALLGWLRWGWRCFSYQGVWRPIHWGRKPKAVANSTPSESAAKSPSSL